MRLAGLAAAIALALAPATASGQGRRAVISNPMLWQGATADEYRQELDGLAATAGIPDQIISEQQLQAPVAAVSRALHLAKDAPDPAVTCAGLDRFVESYDADAVMNLLQTSRGGSQFTAFAEWAGDRLRVLRLAACEAALGAQAAETQARRAELDGYRARLHRTDRFEDDDLADILPSRFGLAEIPQILVARSSAALAYGDFAAFRRDATVQLWLTRSNSDLSGHLAGAIAYSSLPNVFAGDSLAEALAQLEDDTAGRRCLLAGIAAAYRGLAFERFAGSPTGQGCGEGEGARRDYAENLRLVAAALTGGGTAGLSEILPSALPPLRRLLAEIRLERASLSPQATALGISPADESFFQLAFLHAASGELALRPDAELQDELFRAFQEVVSGASGETIALSAAEARADEAGVGDLVREYQALSAMDLSLQITSGPSAPTAADRERSRDRERLGEVVAEIERRFPDYFAAIRPTASSLAEAQAILGEDEAILMIAPGIEHFQVMAVSATGVQSIATRRRTPELNRGALRLLWDLSANIDVAPDAVEARWAAEQEGYGFSRTTAHDLYRELIDPVAGLLRGKSHVFVVAGGLLGGLPLSVLVTEPPQGSNDDPEALRATRWLADRHALVQLPSVQSLLVLRRQPTGPGGTLSDYVGFGDPLFEGPPERVVGPRGRPRPLLRNWQPAPATRGAAALRSLPRLPGTRREVIEMREALGASAAAVHLESDASEAQLRALDLRNAALLVFATHGLMAGEVPGVQEALLALTPSGSDTPGDDGMLTSSEIAALRLEAELVILSACNTASGEASGPQGLDGLARAFFYAGARNLLVSHWPIRDDIAPELTVRIVSLRHANPEMSFAEALQQAMREVRNLTRFDAEGRTAAHPNAWAPFTLLGTAR